MKHDFLDKYAHLKSPIHLLDSRIKLIAALLFIIFINFVNQYNALLLYFLVLIYLIILSKVPLFWFFKKFLILLPFLTLLSVFMLSIPLLSHNPLPLQRIILIWLKSSLSIFIITLLTSVTGFNSLLLAMEKLYFPFSIILISRYAYTYMFILIDEMHIVLRSLKSRAPRLKKKIVVYGNISGLILIKSFSRSQMIYNSMISRNFSDFSRVKNRINLKIKDLVWLGIFSLTLSAGIIL
jgi:cobalt/nickel transport system permease protein